MLDHGNLMPGCLCFSVSEETEGDRLDRFLASETAYSRERIQQLLAQGQVQVDAQVVSRPAYRLRLNQAIALQLPPAQPIALAPEALALDVVFEDAELLVVYKPAGMLTHPTAKEHTGTLVNALLHHCGSSLSGINGQLRPGIVHRLDRDTSGLLMVAKTDRAHQGLSQQLQAKTARRDYIAIAQGDPQIRFRAVCGTIDAPIGRHPKQREKMAVVSDGRPAMTHWQVAKQLGDTFCLLNLSLETGRTHQIRVHLAHIGLPILGDPVYGTGLHQQLKLGIHRQLLQAVRLRFVHPISGQALCFERPMEETLEQVWQTLSQAY